MSNPTVEISNSGRGGSIYYREDNNTAVFDWEFAASPALALIFGPNAEVWDRRYPWAAGRQAEIYRFVGEEAIRQKASGYKLEIELDSGTITIISAAYHKHS